MSMPDSVPLTVHDCQPFSVSLPHGDGNRVRYLTDMDPLDPKSYIWANISALAGETEAKIDDVFRRVTDRYPDIGRGTIQRIKEGKTNPRIDTLAVIADAFGVSVSALLDPRLPEKIRAEPQVPPRSVERTAITHMPTQGVTQISASISALSEALSDANALVRATVGDLLSKLATGKGEANEVAKIIEALVAGASKDAIEVSAPAKDSEVPWAGSAKKYPTFQTEGVQEPLSHKPARRLKSRKEGGAGS